MVNQTTKHGSEALRPMSNSAVPVLFSLKNVQPLILGVSPVAPMGENGQSAAAMPTTNAATSTEKIAKAEIASSAASVSPPTSRPTKVQPTNSLLRTVGTVMLILLFILVIRMSVQSGSKDPNMAVASRSKDAPSNGQLATGSVGSAPVAESSSPMPPLPELEIAVPSLPLLSNSSENVKSPNKMDLAPKVAGLELGGQQAEADIRLDSGASPKSSPLSSVPTLLASVPSTSIASAQSPSPQNDTRDHTSAPLLDIRETSSSELMTPYPNDSEIELAPYGASRPEIRSTNSVRETSTPNLDNMDELYSLFKKGKEGGLTDQSVQNPGNVPVMQISSSNFVSPPQPQTPYIPLSNSTNWPANSLSPAGLNWVPSQGTSAMPTSSTVSNSLPMSGQSYPPPQRVYEPLTVPAYEQPLPNVSASPNNFNRYQPSMIRQPSDPTPVPIAQPRLPYSPVGPMATGATGASYGYPPINVPSN